MQIGKRLLDFILIGMVVFGVSYGIWAIGGKMVGKYHNSVKVWERILEENREIVIENYDNPQFKELFKDHLENARKLGNASRKLEKAEKYNWCFRVVSILIAFLGSVSIIGIVFRPRGLSQKDAFIVLWKFIPQYVKGYFKSGEKIM